MESILLERCFIFLQKNVIAIKEVEKTFFDYFLWHCQAIASCCFFLLVNELKPKKNIFPTNFVKHVSLIEWVQGVLRTTLLFFAYFFLKEREKLLENNFFLFKYVFKREKIKIMCLSEPTFFKHHKWKLLFLNVLKHMHSYSFYWRRLFPDKISEQIPKF